MARSANKEVRAPFSSSASNKSKGKSKPNAGSANKPDRIPARKLNTANAYTFLPSLPKRHRTSEATLSLSKDEAGPSSPRSRQRQVEGDEDEGEEEDENDMEDRIRKLAMKIAADDVGEIDPESEESEIDSDEAWGSDGSDEERWGDVFRDLERGKGKKGKGKEIVKKVCPLSNEVLTSSLLKP